MQSLETERLELVKALLAAFSQGDVERIRSLLTDDVVFHFPGQNNFSGNYKGKDAALGLLLRVNEWTGGKTRIRLHDVLANDQHGVLLYTVTSSHGDREISYRYINLYHFRESQISEVWGVVQDCPEFDDFYSD